MVRVTLIVNIVKIYVLALKNRLKIMRKMIHVKAISFKDVFSMKSCCSLLPFICLVLIGLRQEKEGQKHIKHGLKRGKSEKDDNEKGQKQC